MSAIDPEFAYLLPYVGTAKAAKPKKATRKARKLRVRKPRKMRIRKPRKIRVIRPKKLRVRKIRARKPRRVRAHRVRSRKAIAAQTGYRSSGMAPGFVVVY